MGQGEQIRLGDNFWLHEFTRSETAVREGIDEQFLPLHSGIIGNLSNLVKYVLQPLRVELQARIHILSGYRCRRLNDHPTIGGSENSDHIPGGAADTTSKNPEGMYRLAIAMNLPFKQMIFYRRKNMVHFSYDENDIKRQHWIVELKKKR